MGAERVGKPNRRRKAGLMMRSMAAVLAAGGPAKAGGATMQGHRFCNDGRILQTGGRLWSRAQGASAFDLCAAPEWLLDLCEEGRLWTSR